MNTKSPTIFQNGIIDVFKSLKVYDLDSHGVNYNGEVSSSMDPSIGRKVIKISGNLSATNWVEIPNTKFKKSLNFSSKFYNLVIKTFKDKKYSFQLTFIINNETVVKFTFKYPLKGLKYSCTNSLNIDVPFEMTSNWTLFRFDPVEYINYLSSEIKDLANMGPVTSESTVLRNITFWSSVVVRGLYLSNFLVSPDGLPKGMNFKTNSEKLTHLDLIKREIPNETDEDQDKINLPSETTAKVAAEVKIDTGKDVYTSFKRSKKNNLQEDSAQMEQSLKEIEKKSRSVMKATNDDIMKSTLKRMELTASRISENSKHDYVEPLNLDLKEINSEILRKNMENVNREFTEGKKEIIKTIFRRDGARRVPLLPDPIMHLKFILGFTAQTCPGVEFQVDGKKSLVFASGTTLVRYDYEELRQKFYFGHSKAVTNYTYACDGEVLFSCQEGKNAIIRVWKSDSARCIKMLTTPYEKIYSMSCSRDSALLCTVGLESTNKDTIILWDISNLDDIKVLIRQSSHFSINCVKFSPFDYSTKIEVKLDAKNGCNISFATCGKENIKFWRVKNNHLGGKAVVLNQYAREANFLCMDYDNPLVEESSSKRLFVGSNKGCIFQISATSQELEAIYKIQDQAILSLKVNDAFCATGSLDGYLRIWPIDFKEFLIEAKHDSGVCSVDISKDAMNIICGTLNGSIGLLNIHTKEYKTVLRTPPSQIKSLDASHDGDYLFTIEEDKSIRVWDVEQKSEAFQFVSSKDPPTAIGVPTTTNTIFACGFTSGVLKIFDLINTSILYECKSFNTAVSKIKFIQKDALLLVMNIQGNISIHDSTNNFIQIKLIKIDEPTTYTDLSITLEEDYFATIGPESNCVIVWNANTFGMKNRVPITNFFVKKIDLINRNLLCVVLENCNVQFYSLAGYEGILIREFVGIHSECINYFLHTKNFKFFISGGEEGMIKIWDFKMLYKSYNSYQQFIGHTNGIKGIVCIEQKSLVVTCSENSGIFFWNFLGDVTFCESEITNELDKMGNMKDVKVMLKTLSDPKKTVFEEKSSNNLMKNIRSSHLEKTYNREHNQIHSKSSSSDFNQKKKINFDPSLDEQVTGILYMLPIGQEENLLDVNMINVSGYVPNDSGSIFNMVSEDLESKPLEIEKSEKMDKKLILGFSTNSMKNIILNKEKQWFAFTVNNKIVVEFLEESRSQLILEEHIDEISSIILSEDGNYLISTSGIAHKEPTAPICLWSTSTWTLKKKLSFHYKGVQAIKISSNGKYMISAGNSEEKSICIWNYLNFTVIDSKSLKFPVIDIACEPNDKTKPTSSQNLYTESFLYFVTISFSVISFWRMDSNFRLEGFHLKLEDFTSDKEEGEVLTSITMTPFLENCRTSLLLIGTSTGGILVVDKEKKNLIRKYYLTKSPITKIIYFKDSLIVGGQSPIVYSWKFNQDKIDQETVLDFLEKEKSKLIFVEGNVTSMDFENGFEGLVGTNYGSIFFISFLNESSIKIISSHTNGYVNWVECERNNDYILSTGDDGTLRCWTQDTFDQKFQFTKVLDSKCEIVLLNPMENFSVALYDNSYLRVFNMKTLKSIGKLKIPENDINNISYIFNYQGLILTTLQDKVYVFDVQNWEPLNVLYTEVDNNFMPKNQFFKSIDTKNLGAQKSLTLMSFSDGTSVVLKIFKEKGKVETNIIDKFNMFEYHISKSDDVQIAEMYQNLTKYRTNYICHAIFCKKYDDYLYGFHECLQFLYIRNYAKNEVYRRIPLTYFPSSISLSEDEKHLAIGTKEGAILLMTRLENSLQSGFNLDTFSGHFDYVKSLNFNFAGNFLFSCSHSEVIVWNINEK